MTGPIAEVVSKTAKPFVTKVGQTDSSLASFHDGHVILVGDAFTTFTTHLAMASEHAARHCWQMEKVWRGEITLEERDQDALFYARKFLLLNRLVGLIGLGWVWTALNTIRAYVVLMIKHYLGFA